MSSLTTKRGNYVLIRDPKPHNGIHMPTINDYGVGTVFKVCNDDLYLIIELPNGVKQKIPKGRCTILKDEKEYFKYILKYGQKQ